ncbi:type VII secretion target [Amycolatopsis suaedae]|uniref:ESX-1 secretion-associated protein n=1 Tax=Amycolatopsis suaedae TaxID=2510978 RepID=A0A4Q7JG38_9PSEU|nr:type VII secretion target [Amycolatopsis suaedae]RZQ65684.1 hypothetical protein EWH70_00885 [Amycolatopsis suaedae]
MAPGKGYTVRPGELAQHGGTVDGIAERIRGAAEKGGGFTFGIDTFGIVGQLFAGDAQRVSQEAVREMNDFAGDIRDLAGCVRQAGQLYQTSDDALAQPFKGGE